MYIYKLIYEYTYIVHIHILHHLNIVHISAHNSPRISLLPGEVCAGEPDRRGEEVHAGGQGAGKGQGTHNISGNLR